MTQKTETLPSDVLFQLNYLKYENTKNLNFFNKNNSLNKPDYIQSIWELFQKLLNSTNNTPDDYFLLRELYQKSSTSPYELSELNGRNFLQIICIKQTNTTKTIVELAKLFLNLGENPLKQDENHRTLFDILIRRVPNKTDYYLLDELLKYCPEFTLRCHQKDSLGYLPVSYAWINRSKMTEEARRFKLLQLQLLECYGADLETPNYADYNHTINSSVDEIVTDFPSLDLKKLPNSPLYAVEAYKHLLSILKLNPYLNKELESYYLDAIVEVPFNNSSYYLVELLTRAGFKEILRDFFQKYESTYPHIWKSLLKGFTHTHTSDRSITIELLKTYKKESLINQKLDTDGNTLLHFLAKSQAAHHFIDILKLEPDLTIKNNKGYTVLAYCVKMGFLSFVRYLKEYLKIDSLTEVYLTTYFNNEPITHSLLDKNIVSILQKIFITSKLDDLYKFIKELIVLLPSYVKNPLLLNDLETKIWNTFADLLLYGSCMPRQSGLGCKSPIKMIKFADKHFNKGKKNLTKVLKLLYKIGSGNINFQEALLFFRKINFYRKPEDYSQFSMGSIFTKMASAQNRNLGLLADSLKETKNKSIYYTTPYNDTNIRMSQFFYVDRREDTIKTPSLYISHTEGDSLSNLYQLLEDRFQDLLKDYTPRKMHAFIYYLNQGSLLKDGSTVLPRLFLRFFELLNGSMVYPTQHGYIDEFALLQALDLKHTLINFSYLHDKIPGKDMTLPALLPINDLTEKDWIEKQLDTFKIAIIQQLQEQ